MLYFPRLPFGAALLGICLVATACSPVHAGPGHATQAHGVSVQVRSLGTKVGEYWKFQVEVQNQSGSERRFAGRILLLQQSPAAVLNPGMETVGDCTVFRSIKAGATDRSVSFCKGGAHTAFRFEFTAMYDASDSPLELPAQAGRPVTKAAPSASEGAVRPAGKGEPGTGQPPATSDTHFSVRMTTDGSPIVYPEFTVFVSETRTKVAGAWVFALQINTLAAGQREVAGRVVLLYEKSAEGAKGTKGAKASAEQVASCSFERRANFGTREEFVVACPAEIYSAWRVEVTSVKTLSATPSGR